MAEFYTGYKIVDIKELNDGEKLSNLYAGELLPELGLIENQYLIVTDNELPVDYFICKNNKLKKLKFPKIKNDFTGELKPRNPQQYCALDMLKDDSVPIKLITGKFGTGKSILCIEAAVDAVKKGKFDKIIFVRNNVQVKDTDQLGALPGEAYDKMLPYLMPFADHVGGKEGLDALINCGELEMIPLAYLRGRSIKNAIIYAAEAENFTKQHLQLIMGRVDEGSQLWIDGDVKQRDRETFSKTKGLETMIDRLKGKPLFGYVHLIKSERSEVAAMADLLDD